MSDAFDKAWHDQQLDWLKSVPGYRALLKQRVAEAAKKAELRMIRMDRENSKLYTPIDRLGHDIDPCG